MRRLDSKLFVTLLTLVMVAVMVAIPAVVFAQSAIPSYAVPPAPAANQETIHGRIASYDGAGNLQLNDDRGFVDSVQVQPNTMVNPSNAQLGPGTVVTIVGAASGNVFVAARIDVGQPPVAGPVVPVAPPPPAVPPPPPPPPPPPAAVAAAPGSTLIGILRTQLDSKHASVGQEISLDNVASSDGSIAHATLLGTVSDVTSAGQGRKAQIKLHFDALRRADGTIVPVDGVVVSAEVKTKSNTAKEIGGALVGMLAGNAVGKVLGLNGGGFVGAAGGFLLAKNSDENVVIPANTTVTVQLVNQRRQPQQ